MVGVVEAAKEVSIYRVIEKYAPGFVRPKYNGNASCPFHKDNKPSFHVYDKTNSFHCFSCGASGSGIDFVMCSTGLCDPLVAAETICDDFNLSYSKEPISQEDKLYYDVYAYAESLFTLANTKYVFVDGSTPNDYWTRRGLDSVAVPYGLGYCPPVWLDKRRRVVPFTQVISNRFPDANLVRMGLANMKGDCLMTDRYTIPIRDSSGRTVAFSGRARDETHPAKYKNTPETALFKKRELLYNWDKAKGFAKVFIVEGQLDALSLIVSGVKNVVSVMGSVITPAHLCLLGGAEMILAFDNDKAGKEKTVKFICDNKDRMTNSLKLGALGACKDFNDVLLAGENCADLMRSRNIVSGAEFIMRFYAGTLDLKHLPDRAFICTTIRAVMDAGKYSDIAVDTITAQTRRLLGIKERRL